MKRALLHGCLALAACTTPTLPLPPPTEPSITASAIAGKVHLHSDQGAEPNAIVIAYNKNATLPLDQRVTGTQADAYGSWDMDVIASPNDVIEITQDTDDKRSQPEDVVVPAKL